MRWQVEMPRLATAVYRGVVKQVPAAEIDLGKKSDPSLSSCKRAMESWKVLQKATIIWQETSLVHARALMFIGIVNSVGSEGYMP